MIKSVQKSESVICKPTKPFHGTTQKGGRRYSNPKEAAELKYNLACLLAATVQMENKQLRQELANTQAQAAYCRACYK